MSSTTPKVAPEQNTQPTSILVAEQHNVTQRPELHCPISRLPPELLIHTFDKVVPNAIQAHTVSHLWILAGVCKRWRTIVRSNPTWWAFVRFRGEPSHGWSDSRSDAIDEQLALSQNLPLHLRIVEEDNVLRHYANVMNQYRQALLPHFSRLSSMKIRAFYYRIPLLCGETHQAPTLPNLELLHVSFEGGSRYMLSEAGLRLDQATAPRLTTVSLADYYGHDRIFLPWSQLTVLLLHRCELTHILYILPKLGFEVLRELKIVIRIGVDDVEDASETQRIQLKIPNIVTFTGVEKFTFGTVVHDGNDGDAVREIISSLNALRHAFLSKIRFPALKSFTVKNVWIEEGKPLVPEEFVHSISRSLQHLLLEDVQASYVSKANEKWVVEWVRRFLHLLPNVTHITSTNHVRSPTSSEMEAAILNALKAYPDLCPRLSTLDIGSLVDRDSSILRFVVSMAGHSTTPVQGRKPLRYLRINGVDLSDGVKRS